MVSKPLESNNFYSVTSVVAAFHVESSVSLFTDVLVKLYCIGTVKWGE